MASLICHVPQHAAILSNILVCLEASSTYLLHLDPCCTVTGHTLALKSTVATLALTAVLIIPALFC